MSAFRTVARWRISAVHEWPSIRAELEAMLPAILDKAFRELIEAARRDARFRSDTCRQRSHRKHVTDISN
jgi:hypothetical protein